MKVTPKVTLPPSTPAPATSTPTTQTTSTPTTQATSTQTQAQAQALLQNAPAKSPVAAVPVDARAGKTGGLHALRALTDGAPAAPRYAAIDLGSSSAKMIVVERGPSGDKVLLDKKIGCALGKDVDNGADIPAANQDRAVAALVEFVADAKALGVDVGDIPMITTAVVRNATNGGAFAARVARDVGLTPRVLTGAEEADVGFRGALGALLQTPGRYASLDLGGGSFQLAVGTERGLEQGGSTQVGSNHILDDLINPRVGADGVISAAVFAHVDERLKADAPMPLDVNVLAGRTLVATGGVSKFLRIQLGKDVISRADIDGLRRQLGALSIADRSAFVQQGKSEKQKEALGIGTTAGANDYGKKLPASMSLLLHILDGIGVDAVTVSGTDARHALIAEAAARG